MTFHAYRGNAFEHTHENHAFNRLHDLLQAEWAGRDESLYLFGNFFVEGRELDALVVKRDAIIVIDFKDYGGHLSFSEKGRWMNGDVVVKGGASINPYQQVRTNKFSLLRHIEARVGLQSEPNLGHIAGLVMFHQDIEFDPAELPHNISRWFHIADFGHAIRSIDAIVSREIQLADADLEALAESLSIPAYWPDGRAETVSIAQGNAAGSTHIQWSNAQQRALAAAQAWLAEEDALALVLEGMVSTGKRTLLPQLNEMIGATGQSALLVAPNARIAHRYAAEGLECRSVYSLLYGATDSVVEGRSHYAIGLLPEDVEQRVLVFVEAHLLSNSFYATDTRIYGTGHLLDDLLTALGDAPPRLLIVGDPFQLSRGDLELSLLNAKPIEAVGHRVDRVVLDEQFRPADEPTELLDYQQALAEGMATQHFNRLPAPGSTQVVEYDSAQEGKALGRQLVDGGFRSAYLCGTNAVAQQVNFATREKYLGVPGSSSLAPGDQVDFHGSTPVLVDCDDPLDIRTAWLNAGEIGTVESVDEDRDTRSIRLKGRDQDTVVNFATATVRIPGAGSVRIRYLLDYLLAEKPELSPDQLLAMQIWARQEAELKLGDRKARLTELKEANPEEYKREKSRYSLDVQRLMLADGYFNAARLRFAYAMTVHRAQGRQWQHVLINAKQSSDSASPNKPSYFRWLYTATTCATDQVSLLHYPKLTPLSNAQWKPNSQCQIGPVQVRRQYCYDKQRVRSAAVKHVTTLPGFVNDQQELVALLLSIHDGLQGSSWHIETVAQHDYQEHYLIANTDGVQVKARFSYNADYTVTNVAMEAVGGDEALIDELWRILEPQRIYQAWEVEQAVESMAGHSSELGYCTMSVDEKPHGALVTLQKDQHAVQIKISVKETGMVSSVWPIRASDEDVLRVFEDSFKKF